MTFIDHLLLSILNDRQGKTLNEYQLAEIAQIKDVDHTRTVLDNLAEGHTPIIKTDEGYTIPKNTTSDYIAGMAVITVIMTVPLWW